MKNYKKILIDGAIFGLQKSGGISRIFAELIRGLEEKSLEEIIVLLPKNSNTEWQDLVSSLKKIKVIKRKGLFRSFFLESLYLTMVALKYRPSIWHSSYYVGFPLGKNISKVITFHDMMGEIFRINSDRETKAKYLSLKRATKILAISEHAAKDLRTFWPEFGAKIAVVKNGLNVDSLKEKSGEKRKPYFVYVGRRLGYKNFFPCIKHILQDPLFKDFKIFVLGGEETLTEEEKSLERVVWYKTLPRENVEEIMKGAEVLLFPSLYEGFGLPLLEAFCCEVPVLAFRVSCIPEIVGDDYPLADPLHCESISLTLQKLLQEREKWIAYGRERKKLFTREQMIDTLWKHYETL